VNRIRSALVRRLADGARHDARSLTAGLELDAAALERELRALSAWGLDVVHLPGDGYRLPSAPVLLDAKRIRAALDAPTAASCAGLELLDETDSTNARLLAAIPPAPGEWRACLAEYQSAGRGRRGRAWTQAFGSGLCLSFGWSFTEPPRALTALGLAAGVALLRALDGLGVDGVALKWPNDVLRHGGKLGGILSELHQDTSRSVHVVIGVGLNVRLGENARSDILESGGMDPADLADVEPPVERNRLAARAIGALAAMAREFAVSGFAPFANEWRAADALRDRRVRVQAATTEQEGVARGIDADGALCIEISGELRRVVAGDVSLRAVA